jgi:phage-related protein
MAKPVEWVGSSYKDYRSFPDEVQDAMGFALHLAQMGDLSDAAKPLRGFGGTGVVEIVEDHDGNAYRAVYTVRFADVVYVLHAFQKKSRKGIKTPQDDIALIKRRLKVAEQDYEKRREG